MAERRIHVLSVEDDADIAELTRDMLEFEGFRVTTARDGEEALAQLEVMQPDVIVTDLMMPVLDGFGLIARYRERPGPKVPVIVTSAFRGYAEVALAQGAAAALDKPFSVEALARVIRTQVSKAAAAEVPRVVPATEAELEEQRLRAVVALALAQPMAETDAFAQRVARIFELPICLVSIITADRQYWSSFCGLPPDLARSRGTPRSQSFCTHAVAARAALVVQDTRENPFFRDNELVRTRGFRFYAGVPVFAGPAEAVGTLCVLDYAPHRFSHFDLELLALLAERVAEEVNDRRRDERPGAPESAFSGHFAVDHEYGIFTRRLFASLAAVEEARAAARRGPLSIAALAVARGEMGGCIRAIEAALPTAHVGRLGEARLGVLVPEEPDEVAQRLRAATGAALRRLEIARNDARIDGHGRLLFQVERLLGEAGLAPPAPLGEGPAYVSRDPPPGRGPTASQ